MKVLYFLKQTQLLGPGQKSWDLEDPGMAGKGSQEVLTLKPKEFLLTTVLLFARDMS